MLTRCEVVFVATDAPPITGLDPGQSVIVVVVIMISTLGSSICNEYGVISVRTRLRCATLSAF